MKVSCVCALLLATFTLTCGNDATISVFNNATDFSPYISITSIAKDHSEKNDKWSNISPRYISPGETFSMTYPAGAKGIYFSILSDKKVSDSRTSTVYLFVSYIGIPLKMCFKTWGSVKDPQIGQVDCNSKEDLVSDGGAISIVNDGNYSSEITFEYTLNNDQEKKTEKLTIKKGETKTMTSPQGTKRNSILVTSDDGKSTEVFNAIFYQPVKLCLKIWGTAEATQCTQIDC